MSDLIIEDSLPIGVTVDGKKYKKFAIRPAKLRDSVNAVEKMGTAAATASSNFLRYATMAERVSFEGLEQDQITPELLMDMFDRDANKLEAASDLVEKKLDALSSS